MNHTIGLDESFFKYFFISGFNDVIWMEVKLLNPKTMMDVIALDKLIEDKFNTQRYQVKKSFIKPQAPAITPKPTLSLKVKWLTPK